MRARPFAACVFALCALSCGRASSEIALTAPTTSRCGVTVENTLSGAAPSAGTDATLTVTTARDCTWSASTSSSWIALPSAHSGQGDGALSYRVAANPDPAQRRAVINVNSIEVLLLQDAAPCRFAVTPANTTVSANGGAVTIRVETLTGCSWSAVADAPWMTLPANANGTRSGTVVVTIAANSGGARSGHVTIGGSPVEIAQEAVPPPPPPPPAPAPAPAPPEPTPIPSPTPTPTPTPVPAPCTYSIAPSSANIAAAGDTGSIAVTAGSGCGWTAVSSDSWITVVSGASGTSNGTVTYRVAANSGAARGGSIAVAGKTFTIAQAAAPPACTFSIAPTEQSVSDAVGSGSFAVTASAATCAWTAASNAAWISISSGASGTGNGSVAFSVSANTGAARTGTITAAGKTFTISQAAAPTPPPPCTYTIDHATQTMPASGGTGSVSVTASGSSCTWTAVSNAVWITVTSGATGTGNGTVAFSVTVNTGAARSGTITIAGQTFTVNQDAPPM